MNGSGSIWCCLRNDNGNKRIGYRMANLLNKIMAEGRILFELKKSSILVPLFKRNGDPLEYAFFKAIKRTSGAGHDSHEEDAIGENERIGANQRDADCLARERNRRYDLHYATNARETPGLGVCQGTKENNKIAHEEISM